MFTGSKVFSAPEVNVAVPIVADETRVNGPVIIKANGSNAQILSVCNPGDLSGFDLAKGESVEFDYVGDLRSIYVIGGAENDIVYWLFKRVM